MSGHWQSVAAFTSTLWATRRGRSRASFERWQRRRLSEWVHDAVPRVSYYASQPTPQWLGDLPIIDKALVMRRFKDFNIGRVTAEQGWQAYEDGGKLTVGDTELAIGCSTGTSGNRTLYAITAAEQQRWLGVILAKALPGFMFRRERVAIILPQLSALYETANQSARISVRFFGLQNGIEAWIKELVQFAPTTIVAPPRVLRHLADTQPGLAPQRIFAAGETLDRNDRVAIEAGFDLELGQIYMASEGLLGVSCAHGKLHLAEDTTYFEYEPVAGGLVTPLITCFRRDYQIMARYRMNDLLRLARIPCSCGSPLQAVDQIVGRMDDVFVFEQPLRDKVLITPDVIRNAVLDSDRTISDFRVVRLADGTVELTLPPELSPAQVAAAQAELMQVFTRNGLDPVVRLGQAKLSFEPGQKLRRVENRYHNNEC
ncbi:MAG: CoF synthetase [Rhodobacteraceae bacterium]|nr:CoF synthetase [Paracoccaceae bacterium]